MIPLTKILEQRLSAVLSEIIADGNQYPAMVKASANPQFGDYQANGVMAAAKRNKLNPRELATSLVQKFDINDICQ